MGSEPTFFIHTSQSKFSFNKVLELLMDIIKGRDGIYIIEGAGFADVGKITLVTLKQLELITSAWFFNQDFEIKLKRFGSQFVITVISGDENLSKLMENLFFTTQKLYEYEKSSHAFLWGKKYENTNLDGDVVYYEKSIPVIFSYPVEMKSTKTAINYRTFRLNDQVTEKSIINPQGCIFKFDGLSNAGGII